MSAKKLTTDEEIERQYREYKEQFDLWKETNKHAEGTEAYNNYVRQFEAWEQEVQKRRASMRRPAEHERSNEQNDDAAARAYAAQQEQYLKMHQKGMQEDAALRNRLVPKRTPGMHGSPHTPSNRDVQSALNSLTSAISNAIKSSGSRSPADALKSGIQQSQSATISAPPLMASQAPVNAIQPCPEAMKYPQLWWNAKPAYGPHDRMFRLFGPLAAPTTTKGPCGSDFYSPGWLVQREMAKEKLRFFDSSMVVKLAPHPSLTDPPPAPPPRFMNVQDVPKNFNIPPPFIQNPPVQMNPPVSANPTPISVPGFNPRVPPPPLPMAIPQLAQGGMKRNHSFPGEPMQIHG